MLVCGVCACVCVCGCLPPFCFVSGPQALLESGLLLRSAVCVLGVLSISGRIRLGRCVYSALHLWNDAFEVFIAALHYIILCEEGGTDGVCR